MTTTTFGRGYAPVLAALALTAGLAAAPAALAATVTYNTVSSQLCLGASGCGVSTQTLGGVTVTYVPLASTVVDASPDTYASLGSLVVSCAAGGTACSGVSLAGLNLYLTVFQSTPSSGGATLLAGALSGSISGTSSTAKITWPALDSVTIDTVTYSIANNPLVLVPPSSNAGTTTIQGLISTVPVPPAAWLFGSALGLLSLSRRKTT
jgi:hypothetical protein